MYANSLRDNIYEFIPLPADRNRVINIINSLSPPKEVMADSARSRD